MSNNALQVIAVLAISILMILFYRFRSGKKERVYRLKEPINELERAMLSEPIGNFGEIFQKSTIYSLGETSEPTEGDFIADKDIDVELRGWTANGMVFIPVFTDIKRLQQSGLEGERYIGLNGKDFFTTLKPNTVVVLNHRFDSEMRFVYDQKAKSWKVFRTGK